MRFAFQIKINTDKNQYQNERETRIVFHPIANHPREQINPKTGKKYIEVVMNPDEFYKGTSINIFLTEIPIVFI